VKAGGEAALPARAPVTRAAMTFAWAPVLRSAYSWQYLFFVPMIGVWTSSGSWLLNPFWLLVAWWDSRARTRWLWALPVGRRALLWTIMGPMLAAHALGFYFRRPTGASSEPRVEIVTATAILVYAMLAILFIVLLDWRKLSRVPHRVRRAAFVSLLALWYLTSMALIFLAPYQELMHNGLARLAHALPLGPPALVAAAAALLLALYLAIEKVFSEPDFADKPKPQTLSETAP
ncbi:MAG: hypothetical protein LAQ30_32365, partial [Acidobacteriia bacterium]|nr:hypothetical protein [Terriglobia bacterium]